MARAPQTARNTTRDEVRAPVREGGLRRGEFRGRNGEVLRFRSTGSNQFDIPEDLKDPNWSYQWQTFSVYGEPSNDLSMMYANGWRYVPVDSTIGKYFCPAGENVDYILRGGLVLMERPAELTELYVEETNERTRLQYESLQGKSFDLQVPDGFDNRGKQVRRERALARASDLTDTGLVPMMHHASDDIPDED
jgi:hypothetical protein